MRRWLGDTVNSADDRFALRGGIHALVGFKTDRNDIC
jgi:hypothetical protein